MHAVWQHLSRQFPKQNAVSTVRYILALILIQWTSQFDSDLKQPVQANMTHKTVPQSFSYRCSILVYITHVCAYPHTEVNHGRFGF